MAADDPVALRAVQQVAALLAPIPALEGKVFHVLSEKDLFDTATALSAPAAGVVYDGMRPQPESGAMRTGLAAELAVNVVIFYDGKDFVGQEAADAATLDAIRLLDSVRNAIRGQRGPGNHLWRFDREIPAVEKGSLVVWLQRWTTPVGLAQGLSPA